MLMFEYLGYTGHVRLDSALWFACDATEAVVIVLLLYRRLWRTFPIFLLYVVQALIGDLGGAIILRFDGSAYNTWYLVETIADSLLLFGVLVELAWSVLRPIRPSLLRRAILPLIGVILTVGGAIWPFSDLPALAGASQQVHLIAHLQQTVSIMQIIFLFALIGGSQLLSIGWRDRELQIATGLGFFSLVSISIAVLHTHETLWVQYRQLLLVEIGAYICSMLYWVVSFVQKEAERREFTPEMRRVLLALAGAAHATRTALEESPRGQSDARRRR